jgi:MHS family proline/betaine transporter-like MFS transporter
MAQTAQSTLPKGTVKAIVAGSIGNVVEWVDWSIYGLAAPFIAAQFFPKSSSVTGLLQTYGVFAIGFLARPIGSMIIGPYGDKHGRNKALALSILLMGGGTGLIGILPTYATLGFLAPILLIVLRLAQGLALGGEWGAASAFIYEISPRNRRAFITSFRPCGTGMGFFLGSGFIALVTMIFSPATLQSWGWRVPFILAFLTAVLGLYIRLQVQESPEFLKAKEAKETSEKPLVDSMKYDKRGMIVVFGFGMIWNSVFYVLYTFMPVHLKAALSIPYSDAMKMTVQATLLYTLLVPFFGWVADHVDKKLLLSISTLGLTLFAYPGFRLIGIGNHLVALLAFLAFTLLMGVFGGVAQVTLAEQFPTGTRNTAMGVSYALHNTLFGGTAPLTVAWLTSALHDSLAPSYYMIACSFLGFLAVRYAVYSPRQRRAGTIAAGDGR